MLDKVFLDIKAMKAYEFQTWVPSDGKLEVPDAFFGVLPRMQ